jgi:WD40 repeat protein
LKILLGLVLLILFSCSKNNVEPEMDLFLEIEEINSNVGDVNTVSISPNGNYIAWGGFSNDIKIKGEPSLKGHIGPINALDFNRSGSILLSGSSDHNIKLWDVENSILLRTISEHVTVTRDVKFTPDGKSVISAENNYIVYWRNAVSGSVGKLLLYGHTGTVNSVDISTDMSIIISGSQDKTIKVWDAVSGDLIHTIVEHTSSVRNVEFNPLSNQFASCSADFSVKIWSPDNLQSVKSLEGHEGSLYSISFHPSGKYLAGGGSSNMLYIWDLTSGEIIRILGAHTNIITSVKFGGNGNTVVSGGKDDKVIVWRNVFSPEKN